MLPISASVRRAFLTPLFAPVITLALVLIISPVSGQGAPPPAPPSDSFTLTLPLPAIQGIVAVMKQSRVPFADYEPLLNEIGKQVNEQAAARQKKAAADKSAPPPAPPAPAKK